MINLRETSVRVVTSDAQEMNGAIDQALIQQMRLATSFIEASQESHLAMPLTQPALQAMSEGLGCLVAGREKVSESIREMNRLLANSNLKETGFGCPGGIFRLNLTTPERAVA
jgi:hypothetical protein